MRFFNNLKKSGEDNIVKTIRPPSLGWLEKKLSSQEMDYLWRCVDNRKQKPANDILAGDIHESNLLVDRSDWFYLNTLFPLCKMFEDEFGSSQSALAISQRHPFYLSKFWVNYQKKHDFNPIHNHNGIYSFVIWMKIPYDCKEQNRTNKGNHPVRGHFEFEYVNTLGDINSFAYELNKSHEGTILFFASRLKHQVYPFYGIDEDRISISGNISCNTSKPL